MLRTLVLDNKDALFYNKSIRMMKRLFYLMIAFLMPIMLMAQGAGGEIRRPVRTNTNSNTQPSRHANNARTSERNAILKKLIDNMLYVEGGTYTMGATPDQGSIFTDMERPAHQVTISSFFIAKYEVTQEEWQAVMDNNPSKFKGAHYPVENVTWDDCQVFIRKLNNLTKQSFRLPTEAEWEFAARGGNLSNGYKYAGSNTLDYVAWNKSNSNGTTHNVGTRAPNELGLFDMTGNVSEWCHDIYDQQYYQTSPKNNPQGPLSGSFLMVRGASWESEVSCRISFRSYYTPNFNSERIGLRLVMSGVDDNNVHVNSTPIVSTQIQNNNVDSSVKVYNNPSILLNKDKSLKLLSVSVNKNETILTFSIKNDSEGRRINIDRNAYLFADGVKYNMTRVVDIAYSPDYTYFSYKGETIFFKLYFDVLPPNTTKFDFVENNDSDWKMYGISLKN